MAEVEITRERILKLINEIKKERDVRGYSEPHVVTLKGYSIFSMAGNCCGGDDALT